VVAAVVEGDRGVNGRAFASKEVRGGALNRFLFRQHCAQFEADICPETGAPRVRFNFANGWSGSLVLRMAAPNGCDFLMASVAACPTGQWGTGQTILGPTEARAAEAIDWLSTVASDPSLLVRS
jgi:hypothetical protein